MHVACGNHKRIGNGTMQLPFEMKMRKHKARDIHIYKKYVGVYTSKKILLENTSKNSHLFFVKFK